MLDPKLQAGITDVRTAGLNIMMSMKGDGKPISFIEDAAVPLEDLADYTERLNAVFERHGARGTWYAHASVGCLHVRPVLNMKDPADVTRMRSIAEECFDLVRRYKGSHSGEHGDGIARSEFNEPMFGPRIARAFEAVKDAFDPKGLLNPGRIVRAPRFDDRSLFRYALDYGPIEGFPAAARLVGLSGAVKWPASAPSRCATTTVIAVRFDPGVMCPSYRATRDERHLVRGRANTFRLALTGQLDKEALASTRRRRSAETLCLLQGLPARMSDRRRHGEDEDTRTTAARAARHGIADANGSWPTAALRAAGRNFRRRRQSFATKFPRLRRLLDRHLGLRRAPRPADLAPGRVPRRRGLALCQLRERHGAT